MTKKERIALQKLVSIEWSMLESMRKEHGEDSREADMYRSRWCIADDILKMFTNDKESLDFYYELAKKYGIDY